MTGPVGIDRYVSLVTEKEIPTETMKQWFKCVTDKAPYGVVATFQSIDNDNQPQTVRMVHRETKDSHYYMVPITRDLMEYEAKKIVDAWTEKCPDEDYDIEVTVVPTNATHKADDAIEVDEHKYADLAVAWAKRQHEEWMDAKVKDGWRYSITMDADERTHPLLRPWEDLPDQYRKVDLTQPQKLVDLMSDQGYAVVSKADLEAVQRVLRTGNGVLSESLLHRAGEMAFKTLVNLKVIPILRKNPLWAEAVRVTGHETHYRQAAYIPGTRTFHTNGPAGIKARKYADQLGTIITTLLHDADLPWTVQLQDSLYSALKKECQSGPDGDDPVEIKGATKASPWGPRA